MARSEASALALAAVLVASCAQVTGLGDDYRFEPPDDAGTTADARAEGGSVGDAGQDAAPETCGLGARSRAAQAISSASGDQLTGACRSCLAASCCAPIEQCAANGDCEGSMQCIFSCQKPGGGGNNARAQCLQSCRTEFRAIVGPCIAARCAPPTCALQ